MFSHSVDPRRQAQMMSLALHVAVVALAFALGTSPAVRRAVKQSVSVFVPADLMAYQPREMHGGGGGGDGSVLPASLGALPRAAKTQYTPPEAVLNNLHPRLVMEPTIIAPPEMTLPEVDLSAHGDPLGVLGPRSNGPGHRGGIGSGDGGGVGPGKGPGAGPGESGGVTGNVYTLGGGVTRPVAIFQVEPEFSEEARKARMQGTVLLSIVVDENGRPRDVRVLHPLGMGLDERAIEAVMKWRFKPGTRDRRPVAVRANVEVNFRLL